MKGLSFIGLDLDSRVFQSNNPNFQLSFTTLN